MLTTRDETSRSARGPFKVSSKRALASFPLIALSLAACGDGTDANTDTPTTPTPATSGTWVDGATLASGAFDGTNQDNVFFSGNTIASVDMGEIVNVVQIAVRDANGDVSLVDLQASTNDAASGSGGTTYLLQDVGQNTAGTVLLNFDAQAVDQADTTLDLSLDEVAGTVSVTGGSVETLNLVLAEQSAAESSDLTDLQVQGLTTLNISGGAAGHSFAVQDTLDVSITTLNASGAAADLNLDLSEASTQNAISFMLGTGDDRLILQDGFGSDDTVNGGAGDDTVSMMFDMATIRGGTLADIETLDVVFAAAATFDAGNVTGLTTINLGLDAAGAEVASTADADFNALKAETNTLNIHATQLDVEMDYASGASADLSVNFENDTAAVTIGATGTNPISLTVIDAASLSITHNSAQSVDVLGTTDLSDDADTLAIATMMENGDLRMGEFASATVFSGTSDLEEVSVSATEGDIGLYVGATLNNAVFLADATALQSYVVSGDDASLELGTIGATAAGQELETLSFTSLNEASIDQQSIDASGADIARVSITSSDKNTISPASGPNVNVHLAGLSASDVSQLTINAADGGNILMDQQSYTVHLMTITGSGDFEMRAGPDGLIQTGAAAAGTHSGLRDFSDGLGDDVLYGTNAADEIVFTNPNSTDVYNDAGGNDRVTLTATYDNALLTINDGDAGSDDVYNVANNGISTGAPGPAGGEITFNAGSGDDRLLLSSGFNGDVDINFGTWISGTVTITGFRAGGAGETLSFDGIAGITGIGVSAAIVGSTAVTGFNSNSVYLINDGDTLSNGTTGGLLDGQSIADYENLSDVAGYLNSVTDGSASSGDTAVFIVENGATTLSAGDTNDVYMYLFNDDGSGNGIQAGEIQLIGTIDMSGATPITATDIV